MEESKDLFFKYPHLDSIYRVSDIMLQDEVIATEKIDGSSFRFGIIDGIVYAGTRNRTILKVNKIEPMYDADGDYGFIKWMKDNNIRNRLFDNFSDVNIVFYGEFFGNGIQKRVDYGPDKYFRIFDIRVKYIDTLDFVSWDIIKSLSLRMRLDVVPELYRGKPDPKILESLVVKPSVVASLNGVAEPKNHEGIVIKPIIPAKDRKGDWLITKFKNPSFEERKSKREKTSIESPEVLKSINDFVTEFVTEERLTHVLDHLRDKGIEVNDIKSTPHVLKEFGNDIEREGAKDLINSGLEWKQVGREISRASMLLYKQHLNKLVKNVRVLGT